MNLITQHETGLVSVRNNQAVTTSLKIAEIFEKQHKNVCQAIRNLECSSSFHGLNFKPMSFDVKIGNGGIRKDPGFLLTRDGCAILVMGFTGRKAMEWKEKYIAAFNEMERQIRSGEASLRMGAFNTRLRKMEKKMDQVLAIQRRQIQQASTPEAFFLRRCCTLSAGAYTSKHTLYKAYTEFCKASGHEASLYIPFFRRLYRAGGTLRAGVKFVDGVRRAMVRGVALNGKEVA